MVKTVDKFSIENRADEEIKFAVENVIRHDYDNAVIHGGVGNINESDVVLASESHKKSTRHVEKHRMHGKICGIPEYTWIGI